MCNLITKIITIPVRERRGRSVILFLRLAILLFGGSDRRPRGWRGRRQNLLLDLTRRRGGGPRLGEVRRPVALLLYEFAAVELAFGLLGLGRHVVVLGAVHAVGRGRPYGGRSGRRGVF